jgi:proline dehydrogenase
MITTKIFNNTKRAFSLKTDGELNRAIFMFKSIGSPVMVKVGTFLTNVSLNLRLPVEGLIKKTVFNQFCGGVTE